MRTFMVSNRIIYSSRAGWILWFFILIIIVISACSDTDVPVAADNPPENLIASDETQPAMIIDAYGVRMALIPGGTFKMGSNDGDEDEQPVHDVMLDNFYIDVYEVTNRQYARCVGADVCDVTTDTTALDSSYSRKSYYANPAYGDYPVIYASWYDAQQYCAWREARLPTEAEWEKAARGGLEGKTYPWGDENPVCEFGIENGGKFDDGDVCNNTDSEQVGRYSPNGYGLYDMGGNVWEWVNDLYAADYFANSPLENPLGPEEGRFPVGRGGSWNDPADSLRVSNRRFNDPRSGSLSSGFRCARGIP